MADMAGTGIWQPQGPRIDDDRDLEHHERGPQRFWLGGPVGFKTAAVGRADWE
jgi:hypothetical protein